MMDKYLVGTATGANTVLVTDGYPAQGAIGAAYFATAGFSRISVQASVDGATPSANVDLQVTNFDPAAGIWTEVGNVDAVTANGVISVADLCYRWARVVVSAVNNAADTCDVAIYLGS